MVTRANNVEKSDCKKSGTQHTWIPQIPPPRPILPHVSEDPQNLETNVIADSCSEWNKLQSEINGRIVKATILDERSVILKNEIDYNNKELLKLQKQASDMGVSMFIWEQKTKWQRTFQLPRWACARREAAKRRSGIVHMEWLSLRPRIAQRARS